MINKTIGKESEKTDGKDNKDTKKPNEFGGVYFSSHIKIYDPNTKEVYVQKRADE